MEENKTLVHLKHTIHKILANTYYAYSGHRLNIRPTYFLNKLQFFYAFNNDKMDIL